MAEWKKTTCAFCSVCCGLEMKVENNHIVDVRPDPDNRRSRMAIHSLQSGNLSEWHPHSCLVAITLKMVEKSQYILYETNKPSY